MRNLLYLFVFAALLLGLSACSSYYYSMLNSNDPVGEKNERGDFVQENDCPADFFYENLEVFHAVEHAFEFRKFVKMRCEQGFCADISGNFFDDRPRD